MKVAILSDIHANLEALQSVLQVCEREGIGRIICLGDVVGYGPNPNECVALVGEVAEITLLGNHDQVAMEASDPSHFNPEAREAILWTRKQLTNKSREFIARYEMHHVDRWWEAVHATPDDPAAWHYLWTGADIRRSFSHLQAPLCFVGHSHIPGVYLMNAEGTCFEEEGPVVKIEPENRYLINVGSVGQPRDGNPMAAFGVWDVENRLFSLVRVPYPVHRVQKKMVEAGLPEWLAYRLSVGE